jgi:signal recognition particle subunit SRP54
MGDQLGARGSVASFIEAFENVVHEGKAERDARTILRERFDLNDFSEQVQLLKKMSRLTDQAKTGLDELLPDRPQSEDEELGAMLSSMTKDERRHPERFLVTRSEPSVKQVIVARESTTVYDGAYDMVRLRRVAQGSGHTVHAVIDLLNRFAMMRRLRTQIRQSIGRFG